MTYTNSNDPSVAVYECDPTLGNNIDKMLSNLWEKPPFLHASHLTQGMSYEMRKLESVQTKFGGSTVAFIVYKREVRKIFLPTNYHYNLSDKYIEEIHSKKINLAYTGLVGRNSYEFRSEDRNETDDLNPKRRERSLPENCESSNN